MYLGRLSPVHGEGMGVRGCVACGGQGWSPPLPSSLPISQCFSAHLFYLLCPICLKLCAGPDLENIIGLIRVKHSGLYVKGSYTEHTKEHYQNVQCAYNTKIISTECTKTNDCIYMMFIYSNHLLSLWKCYFNVMLSVILCCWLIQPMAAKWLISVFYGWFDIFVFHLINVFL